MDPEIKRLLSLDANPGFKLNKRDAAKLAKWKEEQKAIKPKKARKTRRKAPKGYTIMEGMGAGDTPTIVKTSSLGVAVEMEKTTNEVKEEEKEEGKVKDTQWNNQDS